MVDLYRETASASDLTVHDERHVEGVWEMAGTAACDVASLTPLEVWILMVAVLFHDAASGLIPPDEDIVEVMGRDRWRDLVVATFREDSGRWPDDREIGDPPDEVYEACVMRALRETHAERGGDLALKPWKNDEGQDEFLIDDTDLRGYGTLIGNLAASHWADADDLPSLFAQEREGALPPFPGEWTVDPLKLACILRIADATHIDSRRAPPFLYVLRSPTGLSRQHWIFQRRVVRPVVKRGRITYTSLHPFGRDESEAWWLAWEYLGQVDRELQRVDQMLCRLGQPRLKARGVAGIDKPEHFARSFKVKGWQPADARVGISDVDRHVRALGGEQLYGRGRLEAGLRELVQNAQDAILARRAVQPEFEGGSVRIRLVEQDGGWLLEVGDDGVGMDPGTLRAGLLDFGRSGWTTDVVRKAFPGLLSAGFRPAGRFGVGFYAVQMLGDEVTLTTRRIGLGADQACELRFAQGVRARPMICPVPEWPMVPEGTVVEVVLRDPPRAGGLLATTVNGQLVELVRRVVPSHKVPLVVEEEDGAGVRRTVLLPFDLATAPVEEVFDRLYPPGERHAGPRREARAEFCAQATEIFDEDDRRIGIGVLGGGVIRRDREALGVTILDGFRADRCEDFTGYIDGRPGRASRDQVEPACSPDQLTEWVESQVDRLRRRGLYDASTQLELAEIVLRSTGGLPDDHCVALTADGLLQAGGIATWAARHDEILVGHGGPCEWETRPPGLWDRDEGRSVVPPPGWLVFAVPRRLPTFAGLLPQCRGELFAEHRQDSDPTWQRYWWRASGDIEGLLLEGIRQGWGCTPGELLGPVADRGWKDHAALLPGITESQVLRLERPRR
jgi:hypothetical protein